MMGGMWPQIAPVAPPSSSSSFVSASPAIRVIVLEGFVKEWTLDEDAQAALYGLEAEIQEKVMEGFAPADAGGDASAGFVVYIDSVQKDMLKVASTGTGGQNSENGSRKSVLDDKTALRALTLNRKLGGSGGHRPGGNTSVAQTRPPPCPAPPPSMVHQTQHEAYVNMLSNAMLLGMLPGMMPSP